MAGSRLNVEYTADDGVTKYCINVDESNIELVMGAQVAPSGAFPRPPQGFRPRKVVLSDSDGLIKRTVPVLNLARYAALNGSTLLTLVAVDSADGTEVRVINKAGEKQRNIPRSFDTGQKDGD